MLSDPATTEPVMQSRNIFLGMSSRATLSAHEERLEARICVRREMRIQTATKEYYGHRSS
jgi:hypothetical protein